VGEGEVRELNLTILIKEQIDIHRPGAVFNRSNAA
jgi:hypothetical protein